MDPPGRGEELSEEDKKKAADEQIVLTEQLVMGHKVAQMFENLLWFELGKLIWKFHRQVYYDHIQYLQQHICKPFKWTIIQYIPPAPYDERVELGGGRLES